METLENEDGEIDYASMLQWVLESNFTQYLSENTLVMMGTVMTYMIEGKEAEAEKEVVNWYDERLEYLFSHLQIQEWTIFGFEAFCYYVLMGKGVFGKVSPMNVWFTALPWTLIGIVLVGVQIGFLIFWNRWFADGNLLLIGMEAFTMVQLISSIFLAWNFEFFDYNRAFRIWRYVSLGLAADFSVVYVIGIFTFYEYVNLEDVLHYDEVNRKVFIITQNLLPDDGTYEMFDVLFTLVIGYCLLTYLPTFLVQLVIIAKEMTMK